MSSDSQITQLKRLAPFLDSHVLLQFLKTHVPGSEKLQQQLSDSLLISQKDKLAQVEEEAKTEAVKLLTLLNNHEEY